MNQTVAGITLDGSVALEPCYWMGFDNHSVNLFKGKKCPIQESDYLLSIGVVAEIIGKSESVINDLLNDLSLQAVVTQGDRMVTASSLRRYIAAE